MTDYVVDVCSCILVKIWWGSKFSGTSRGTRELHDDMSLRLFLVSQLPPPVRPTKICIRKIAQNTLPGSYKDISKQLILPPV